MWLFVSSVPSHDPIWAIWSLGGGFFGALIGFFGGIILMMYRLGIGGD